MKKYLGWLVVMMLAVFILSACGGGRDLSTPSSRMIGHWKTGGIDVKHYYFSAIDEETGEGKITLYSPNGGRVETGTYIISSEQPEGEEVEISVLWSVYAGSEVGRFYLEIPEEAMEARLNGRYVEYVDDKTEYEPEK